jgi:hypothetical protein
VAPLGFLGAALDQHLHRRRAAGLGREVQRRIQADARHRCRVGAGHHQQLRQLGVATLGRPVQRGHAVALRRADIDAVLDQRGDGGLVAAHRRVGQRRG